MANSTPTTQFRFWLWLIALIGVIVPRRLRADWRQEWEAELRYREQLLAEWDRLDWRNKFDLLRRSLGAFRDAMLLQPRRLEDEMFQDIRFGVRMLMKNPGFTLVAVFTLALGIGATTTMYSVVYNVLIDPFTYADADRIEDLLIQDLENPRGGERGALPVAEFLDYQEQSQVFEEVIGSVRETVLYTTNEGAEPFGVAWVTPNAFRFLGVAPLIGRPIVPEDGKPGAPPVAVLSHKIWVNRFGGDASVLGRTLTLNDVSYTVVGVMPPRFAWHFGEAWIPSPLDRSDPKAASTYRWFQGRLKPGVTREQATAELNMIARRLSPLYPQLYPKRFTVILKTPVDFVVGRFRGVLYTLMGAVGVLLLIACCNVANMLLARATSREKEMAIRAALGAGRRRIFQQLLTESVLLALAGAAGGCLLAYGGVKALLRVIPDDTIPGETEIALNAPVLLFSLAAAGLTVLLFGLAPALQSVRRNVAQGLTDTGKGSGGGSRRGRLRNALVVVEVALSLVLLFGGALLIRGFLALTGADLGFREQNVLLTRLSFSPGQYKTGAEKQAFLRQVSARIAALPGVVSMAVANGFPPFGGATSEVEIPGGTPPDKSRAIVRLCGDGYFHTLGLRSLRGRPFNESEVARARRVAVINETLARRYFGGDDPLGKQIALPTLATIPDPTPNPVFEVVGVVADAKNQGVQDPVRPEVFLPFTLTSWGNRVILAQTSIDPGLLTKAAEQEIWAVDRGVGTRTMTMANLLRAFAYAQPRFSLILLNVFAGLSLLMVAIGVYSVMSYTVSRRTHEIGIRMALGATGWNVLRLMLRQSLTVALIGIALGLSLAIFCARLITSFLYGLSPIDPAAIVLSTLLLILVALLASYLPARRATKVDPLTALRHE